MDLDTLVKVAGMTSGVGAIVGGTFSFLFNWFWKWREQRDCILVVFGSTHYDENPGTSMYVVNLRSHLTEIVEYGFVLRDGRLLSVPSVWSESMGEDSPYDATSGSTILKGRNEKWEIKISLGPPHEFVGAFATTTNLQSPTLSFPKFVKTTFFERARIRLKNWLNPEYR